MKAIAAKESAEAKEYLRKINIVSTKSQEDDDKAGVYKAKMLRPQPDKVMSLLNGNFTKINIKN